MRDVPQQRKSDDDRRSPQPYAATATDPADVKTSADLVAALVELRMWAGQPSLRSLRRLAGTTVTSSGDTVDALPSSTISYVLNGRGLPRPPRMEFVDAFVAACLLAADRPEDEVPVVIERWRTAWHRVARAEKTQPRAEKTQPRAEKTQPRAEKTQPRAEKTQPHAEQTQRSRVTVPAARTAPPMVTADAGYARSQQLRSRRPVKSVVIGAIVLAAAGGVTWWALDGRDRARPAPPVYREGSIAGLRDTEGVDLDTGRVGEQNGLGVDLSPWGRGNHVVTRTSAMITLLPEPGDEAYHRCAGSPASERVLQVKGLHDLAAGRNLCVWTTEGNVSMLTLTSRPEPQSGTLSFRYVVWESGAQ
jgi:hypothetical protein